MAFLPITFADGKFSLPRIGTDGYIDELIKLCNDNDVSLVVPTMSHEMAFLPITCARPVSPGRTS